MNQVNDPYRAVVSPSSPIVVNPAPGIAHRGRLILGPLSFPCALGRSGMVSCKREGDGGTPLGRHPILFGYRRADRNWRQSAPLPLRAIRPTDGWCDAPSHPAYNRPVQLPLSASHEIMRRDDRLYDLCIVLDYNFTKRVRGAGSAIFFHLAKPGFPPTEGCVALAPQDMARLLPYLKRGRALIVRR